MPDGRIGALCAMAALYYYIIYTRDVDYDDDGGGGRGIRDLRGRPEKRCVVNVFRCAAARRSPLHPQVTSTRPPAHRLRFRSHLLT